MTRFMNVVFVYSSFSHKKSTNFLLSYCEKHAVASMRIDLNELLNKHNIEEFLEGFTHIFLSLGGWSLNHVLKEINKLDNRPYTISLFPGIVVKEQIEAFFTRTRCDLVLLNSKKDERYYKWICKHLNTQYNGFLFGAPWYFPYSIESNQISREKKYIYTDQIEAPKSESARIELLNTLSIAAKKYPDIKFAIKYREDYKLHPLSINNLFKKISPPPNLVLTSTPLPNLLQRSTGLISISSSAILEAILHGGLDVIVLEDYFSNNRYTHFYEGSGLIKSLEDLGKTVKPSIDDKWKELNCTDPSTNVESLFTHIKIRSTSKSIKKISKIRFMYFLIFIFKRTSKVSWKALFKLSKLYKYIGWK